MPQATEAGRDVQRDVLVGRSTGEPRPRAIGELLFGELAEQPGGFVVQPVVVEQDADVATGLAFGLGLPQPGSLLDHDRLQFLVLFQRAVECGRAAPLLEDAVDLRIAPRDVPGQRVGIQPVEGLLGAFVRGLHQIRQRHHGVPRRIGDHLHGQRLVLERVGFP